MTGFYDVGDVTLRIHLRTRKLFHEITAYNIFIARICYISFCVFNKKKGYQIREEISMKRTGRDSVIFKFVKPTEKGTRREFCNKNGLKRDFSPLKTGIFL